MKWSDFVAASPKLAALGEERMEQHGVILLGTLRRDGPPRITPVEPLIVDDELELGMMWPSKKAFDLLRDPRCQVHTVITDRNGTEGEFLRASWRKARGDHWRPRLRRSRQRTSSGGARGTSSSPPASATATPSKRRSTGGPRSRFTSSRSTIQSASYRRFSPDGKVYALVWKVGRETVESEHRHEA
jgi:hypothetical protein